MECVSFDHIKRRRFGQTLRNKWRFSCFSRFPEPFLSCFEWTCSFMGKSVKSGRIVNLLLASQSQKADVFFLVRHPWSSVAMHEKTRSYTYIKAQPKMPDWNVLEHFNLASWAVSNSLLSPDIRAVRSFEKHIGSRKSINTKPGPKFSLNRAFQSTFWNSVDKNTDHHCWQVSIQSMFWRNWRKHSDHQCQKPTNAWNICVFVGV